jgi:hypothetical protein
MGHCLGCLSADVFILKDVAFLLRKAAGGTKKTSSQKKMSRLGEFFSKQHASIKAVTFFCYKTMAQVFLNHQTRRDYRYLKYMGSYVFGSWKYLSRVEIFQLRHRRVFQWPQVSKPLSILRILQCDNNNHTNNNSFVQTAAIAQTL